MPKRRRFKQLLSLGERLDREAARLRAEADNLPYGPEREKSGNIGCPDLAQAAGLRKVRKCTLPSQVTSEIS